MNVPNNTETHFTNQRVPLDQTQKAVTVVLCLGFLGAWALAFFTSMTVFTSFAVSVPSVAIVAAIVIIRSKIRRNRIEKQLRHEQLRELRTK